MNRLEASSLLARFQTEMRSAAIVDRRRAYLPEAVDQYELRYLTGLQESRAHVRFELFDGRTVDGRVSGFGPYHITVVQEDGSELTLNKLALVSYRRAASGGEQPSASLGDRLRLLRAQRGGISPVEIEDALPELPKGCTVRSNSATGPWVTTRRSRCWRLISTFPSRTCDGGSTGPARH